MKKLLAAITLAIMVATTCAGCAARGLEYDMNLGYDFNNVKSKDISFNVYHVNDKDHSWELLKSLPCTPQPGHYNDVKLECDGSKITAVLRDSTYTEAEDGSSASYDGDDVSSFEFDVEGFKGWLPGWKSFEVEDKTGEQLVRLYPITNSGGFSILEDIGLDKPYDTEGDTIDDVLITVVMK